MREKVSIWAVGWVGFLLVPLMVSVFLAPGQDLWAATATPTLPPPTITPTPLPPPSPSVTITAPGTVDVGEEFNVNVSMQGIGLPYVYMNVDGQRAYVHKYTGELDVYPVEASIQTVGTPFFFQAVTPGQAQISAWISGEIWDPACSCWRWSTLSADPITVTVQGSQPPAWAPYTAYEVDELVSYEGNVYSCWQAHTSLPNWCPPIVPALWRLQE